MGYQVRVYGFALMVAAMVQPQAWSQTSQPTKPATSANDIKTPFLDNYTPSEEVQRRASGPLRIIRQLGDATQKKAAAAPNAPAAAAVLAPKPKAEESVVKTARAVPAAAAVAAPVAASLPPETAPVLPEPVLAPTPPPVAVATAPVKEPNLQIIPISQVAPVPGRNVMRDISRALVRVAFDINTDGKTSSVEIVSSNNRKFNSAVVEAVTQWRFKPIDEAVRVETEIAYTAE